MTVCAGVEAGQAGERVEEMGEEMSVGGLMKGVKEVAGGVRGVDDELNLPGNGESSVPEDIARTVEAALAPNTAIQTGKASDSETVASHASGGVLYTITTQLCL